MVLSCCLSPSPFLFLVLGIEPRTLHTLNPVLCSPASASVVAGNTGLDHTQPRTGEVIRGSLEASLET